MPKKVPLFFGEPGDRQRRMIGHADVKDDGTFEAELFEPSAGMPAGTKIQGRTSFSLIEDEARNWPQSVDVGELDDWEKILGDYLKENDDSGKQ
jgi:hypothetical protein